MFSRIWFRLCGKSALKYFDNLVVLLHNNVKGQLFLGGFKMTITKGRLVYNLSLIVVTLVLGIVFYGSQFAPIFFVISGIGIFMTLDRVVERSKKNFIKFGIPIGFVFFIIVFVSQMINN